MKETLFLLLCIGMPCVTSAQENEAVDSIDEEAGVICYADFTQVNDTISTDTIDCANPPISQIPLEECDSMMVRDITDHYGVGDKDGKCGIYDLVKGFQI